jgi:hypothetical protein
MTRQFPMESGSLSRERKALSAMAPASIRESIVPRIIRRSRDSAGRAGTFNNSTPPVAAFIPSK